MKLGIMQPYFFPYIGYWQLMNAVENLLLEAVALGLGALWIGNTFFAYDEIAAALEIQGQLLGAVAVGWPDETSEPRPRKSMEEIAGFLP